MNGINVKEIAENEARKKEAYPADITATARVRELSEAIATYTYSDITVAGTEMCMVYAEELLDQLALMKKYGKQNVVWLARNER